LLQEQLQSTQEQVDELEARIKKYLANILKVGCLTFISNRM
jgi:peptidoglycan hydrolase CwlO-like protein